MKNKNALLLILLATCWGPSFMLIKIAVEELSPLMITGLRVALGAAVLNAIRLARGFSWPRNWHFWRDVLFTGFFSQALPFTLINWGEQYVDSSLASLLNGLTPLSTIVLAHVMLDDERMNRKRVSSVLLGVLGLLVLVMPDMLKGFTASTMGIIAITAAALSYGLGLVYARRHFSGLDPIQAPSAQLLTVGLYLLPAAFLADPVSFDTLSGSTIASVLVLGVFGTGIAFLLYFKLLKSAGPGYVATCTFLLPIYGIVLGVAFLDEVITASMLFGSAIILLGVAIANGRTSPRPKARPSVDVAAFSKVR